MNNNYMKTNGSDQEKPLSYDRRVRHYSNFLNEIFDNEICQLLSDFIGGKDGGSEILEY
ncbi:MAG: hypothetical protein PF689_05790 [Deltaproteobacteria bacterium]|jgi:hypothetical protein|nr:hypothetical protein [Deltaproteobacteria bacterium]